jgi:hypothetical protein
LHHARERCDRPLRPPVSGFGDGGFVARDNFGFGKRQRELSKERKKEEKRQRKADRQNTDQATDAAPQEQGEEPGAKDDRRL